MQIAAAQQMRELDRIAIKERGIPSTDLMERAAGAVADAACGLAEEYRKHTPQKRGPLRAVCFCGAGNNGGDGVAAARLLLERGLEVHAVLAGRRDKMTPDCQEMERRLQAAGGELASMEHPELDAWCQGADVLVDALFGIGLNTQLRGDPLGAVQRMNAAPAPVVSADIPSGVEADTGHILGTAVEAEITVTFSLPKPGLYLGNGIRCAGQVMVADIGIPPELVNAVESTLSTVEPADITLPRRDRMAHKGQFGKVYLLSGSVNYPGAPVLAARAAVRAGAGLVTVGVPAQVWPTAAAKLASAMPQPLPAGKDGTLSLEAAESVLTGLSSCGVCLIGPGLGRSKGAAAVVRRVLSETQLPVVLDADGINALEGHIDVLDGRAGLLTILTPHDGEFARLIGALPGEDRLAGAVTFAQAHSCCLVLKGHRTITAFPDGAAYLNTTGNPGMAKGGSGDVLGGIITALLGQGLSARQAVPAAVCLHGEAGDLCAQRLGEYGMTPSDMIDVLPQVVQRHTARF